MHRLAVAAWALVLSLSFSFAASAQDAMCGYKRPAKAGETPAAPDGTVTVAGREPPNELVLLDTLEGTGTAVAFRSPILVNYTGWLYSPCAPGNKGAMFDTNGGPATPFSFMVGAGKVIKGWDEGVVGMKKGGKRTLIIPADKAYGDRSPSPKIPPNSTLVFDIEVIHIIGTAPSATPAPAPAPSK